MAKSLLKPAPLTLLLFLGLTVPAVLLYQPGNRVAEVLGLTALLVAGSLLVFCVHELGHVACGLLRGYRFVALFCGPLAVSRVGARLTVEWNDQWAFYGGAAIMAPRGGLLPPSRDGMVLYAGGPLASLIFGVLFVAIHFGLDLDGVTRRTIAAGTHTPVDLVLGVFTMVSGILSFGIAVATMIPNAMGGFLSDGAAIRTLLKGGPEAERLLAMSALVGQFFEGIRPRDWSPEYIRSAVSVQDGAIAEGWAARYGLLHALDRGDLAAARVHLARMAVAVEKAPAWSRGELRVAEAWLAVADGRLADARAAFEQVAEASVDEWSRRRVLAAILLGGGNAHEGQAVAREGLALMDELAVKTRKTDDRLPGEVAMEREWLEQLAEGRLPAVLTRTSVVA